MNMLAASWLNIIVRCLTLYSNVLHLLPAIFLFVFRFERRKLLIIRIILYILVLLAISYATVFLDGLGIPDQFFRTFFGGMDNQRLGEQRRGWQ